jgi:hypothetical protein
MTVQNVSTDSLAAILERMEVRQTLDLGVALIHVGTHPELAECVTVQDAANDKAALVTSVMR